MDTFAFTPDGQSIAIDSAPDTVTLLDTASGKAIKTLRSTHPRAYAMTFSPDAKWLVLGGSTNTVQLWDVDAGKLTLSLEGHKGEGNVVTGVAFVPGENRIASCSEDGSVRVWDINARKAIHVLTPPWPKADPETPADRQAGAVAVSGNGEFLAVGYQEGSVCVWSTRTWRPIHFTRLDRFRIFRLEFSSTGALAWGGGDIGVYDLHRRQTIWKTHTGPSVVTLSQDGRTLVSGGATGLIQIWDVLSGKVRPSEPAHLGGTYRVAFSPRGDGVVSIGADAVVRLWNRSSQTQTRSWPQFSKGWLCPSLAFPTRTAAVVFAETENKLTFQDPAKRVEKGAVAPLGSSRAFVVSADGQSVAVRTRLHNEATGFYREDTIIELHDLRSRKRLFQLSEPIPIKEIAGLRRPSPYEGGLAFSPDNHLLATSYLAQSILLWDLRSRKQLGSFDGHRAPVCAVTFSRDGTQLASCASGEDLFARRDGRIDDSIRIWDVSSRRQVGQLPGPATGLAYSPAGDLLASVMDDGLVRVWEVISGREVLRMRDQDPNGASAATFSPDGSVLATAMWDGTILIWSLHPLDWKRTEDPRLELLWKDLSSGASKAYAGILTLAAHPRTVAFLDSRLARVDPVDAQRIRQLIDELDDESFQKREKALESLGMLGHHAEAALRRGLMNPRSQEARDRLTRLLRRLDNCFVTDPRILQQVRAIGVLRRIGTPAARSVLERLAKGAPEVMQTRAARSALQALRQASL